MGIIIWLIVGGIVGWLASLLMKRDAQQGILLNIVVGIVGVDVGVQGSCIDDNRRYSPTSADRISSMRSEISWRPLRPAAAAFRCRRPPGTPKYASSASRLTSEIVIFRNSAS